MDFSTKLKEKGWYFTESGITKLQSLAPPGTNTVQKLIDIAMNLDLREVGGGAIALKRAGKLTSGTVLQILKIRNISAPRANEDSKVAPILLQIEFSDGQQTITALELEHNADINLNIPPGTKVLHKASRFKYLGPFVELLHDDLQVLGGQVTALIEKWELARSMHQFSRDGNRLASDTGPPVWVPFGRKLDILPVQKNFKSMATVQTVKKNENESFNAFRSEAIAEASKQGAKKVFSAGQQIVDSNMKRIIDKGYTEEEAKRALAQTNNNLERAFSHLKRAKSSYNNNNNNTYDVNNKRFNHFANNNNNNEAIDASSSKPTGNVTLSAFLADKLGSQRQSESTEKSDVATNVANENNKMINRQTVGVGMAEQMDGIKTMSNHIKSSSSYSAARRESTSATRFENNMSSSFAESQRYRGSNGHHSRYNNNNYNGRNAENGARMTRTIYNSRGGKRNGNNNEDKPKENNAAKYVKGKKSYSPTNNNNNKFVSNNNHVRNEQKQHYSNNNNNSNSNTKDIKLENGSQMKQQQKSQKLTTTTANLPKMKSVKASDPFDASKIIGFQSKETNELALNLLKSEGVNLKPAKNTATTQHAMIKPFKSIKNEVAAAPTHTYNMQLQKHISKEEQLAAGFDFGNMEPWTWRIGDLCMAKYWDDGCFYKAEITAISEKTFVVYFMGYGNHEEVLKADCLPITDEEHRPINNHIHPEHDERNPFVTNNTHRQRFERQVYVPPAKRSEN